MAVTALYDLPAPAKLNLFLHVVGRRPDGYHLLQSVFVLIDWADRLHLERRTDGRLTRHDLGPALPADDLTLRAARALQAASACTLGADIHIQKNLPWGAGMGGGSSDAATTLLALNQLWGLHWPRERLATIGLSLGADVPFFVHGRNAFVEGIGEQLRPITTHPSCYAVLKPAASLETQSIFSHPALKRNTEAAMITGSFDGTLSSKEVPAFEPGFGRNDLQGPAEDRCPDVAQAARWLEARYGNSRMTGSGSAVFARVEISAGNAAPPLAKAQPQTAPTPTELAGVPAGWVGRLCRGLEQHPLREWAAPA
jgi:4-diphosphocytidyl-2-C-methyl-D-erythritol kinase